MPRTYTSVASSLLFVMVLSTYEKQRILNYHLQGLLPSQILSALKVEGIVTTRQTIARFIKHFRQRVDQ